MRSNGTTLRRSAKNSPAIWPSDDTNLLTMWVGDTPRAWGCWVIRGKRRHTQPRPPPQACSGRPPKRTPPSGARAPRPADGPGVPRGSSVTAGTRSTLCAGFFQIARSFLHRGFGNLFAVGALAQDSGASRRWPARRPSVFGGRAPQARLDSLRTARREVRLVTGPRVSSEPS